MTVPSVTDTPFAVKSWIAISRPSMVIAPSASVTVGSLLTVYTASSASSCVSAPSKVYTLAAGSPEEASPEPMDRELPP